MGRFNCESLDQTGFLRFLLCEDHLDPVSRCHVHKDDEFKAHRGMCVQVDNYLLATIKKDISKIKISDLLDMPVIINLFDQFIRDCGEATASGKFKKNAAKSVEYRTTGNEMYSSKCFASASYYYTMAIVFAPNVEENVDIGGDSVVPLELSLAFGNRSALFFELGWFPACLTDIEHALATGYPLDKRPRLLLRKVETLLKLKRFFEAKQTWRQLESRDLGNDRIVNIRFQLLDVEDSPGEQKQAENEDDQLGPHSVINFLASSGRYEPSPDDECISAKVEIQTSNTKGRLMVAKKNIAPGEIVTIESPFAVMLDKSYELHYCHHCCRKLEVDLSGDVESYALLFIDGPVLPCTNCTQVLYCSSTCRTQSWKSYHRFECGQILSVMHQMNVIYSLPLRILFSTGLNVISAVHSANAKSQCKVEHVLPQNSDPIDPEAMTNYERFYGLAHNMNLKSVEELRATLVIGALLMHLAKKCGFIRSREEEMICDQVLQRHLFQVQINYRAIQHSFKNDVDNFFWGTVASAVYLRNHVLNHSCERPTVVDPIFVRGSLCLHRAVKPIATGQEITECYLPFRRQDLTDRRDRLLKAFNFRCYCARCVRELRDSIDGRYFPIACKKCGGSLSQTIEHSGIYHCNSCSNQMSLLEMKRLYSRIESLLTSTSQMMHENRQFGELPLSEKPLAIFGRQVVDLINIPGMHAYWRLGDICGWATCQYSMLGMSKKELKFTELGYPACEQANGVSSETYDYLAQLSNLYLDQGLRNTAIKCLQRAIKMIQVLALIDLERANPPVCRAEGGGLLDEESFFFWERYRLLAQNLKEIEQHKIIK